jgi:hypothetical protein
MISGFNLFVYIDVLPWISLSSKAMIAITNRICMILPALKAKNPIAQAIIRIIARI